MEYVRARARIFCAWGRLLGVGRERIGLVFSSVIVRDCSSCTRDWIQDRRDGEEGDGGVLLLSIVMVSIVLYLNLSEKVEGWLLIHLYYTHAPSYLIPFHQFQKLWIPVSWIFYRFSCPLAVWHNL